MRRALLLVLGLPWAEVLTALALLSGWACLTYAAAALCGRLAYPISGGLLLLSLCGWRFLGVVAWNGLYSLTRGED